MRHAVLKYTEHLWPSGLWPGRATYTVPDRLLVKPVDLWPGNPENAHNIVHHTNLHYVWPDHLHDFSWLRDLSTYGGLEGIVEAQNFARDTIETWVDLHRKKRQHPKAWTFETTGQRLSMWIAFYEFFGADAEEEFQDIFFESLIQNFAHLHRGLNTKDDATNPIGFQAVKGVLYAALALEGLDEHIPEILKALSTQMNKHILGDGGHISRSPKILLRVLQILLDIRTALNAAGQDIPQDLADTIQRTSKAVQFFRYHDKGFALFHGTNKGHKGLIDRILAQAGVRGKTKKSLPDTKFERVSIDRTTLMVDVGGPHQDFTHHAPLAFELCHGKNRVFTACGAHDHDPAWQEALKTSSAHNTLTIDEHSPVSYSVQHTREDTNEACLIRAVHDGYVKHHGLRHERSLYLSDNGHDLRGADVLSAEVPPSKAVEIAVRFHIHPTVMVSLIQDGQEALLRLPGGTGWRFSHAGGVLTLQDSVYWGNASEPRKTKQLVIHGIMGAEAQNAEVKWSFRREG